MQIVRNYWVPYWADLLTSTATMDVGCLVGSGPHRVCLAQLFLLLHSNSGIIQKHRHKYPESIDDHVHRTGRRQRVTAQLPSFVSTDLSVPTS